MASFTPTAPAGGAKITLSGGKLQVPNNPIIPFIEGDGTGPDIWRASVRVLDAAVATAYGGKRKIHWLEIYAGEKANNTFGRSEEHTSELKSLMRISYAVFCLKKTIEYLPYK